MKHNIYESFLLYNNGLYVYDRRSGKVFKEHNERREEITDPNEVIHLLTGHGSVISSDLFLKLKSERIN